MRGACTIALLSIAACGDGATLELDAAPIVLDAPLAADAGVPDARPTRLSETRLYSDFAARTIAAENLLFAPKYVLWSDGAHKRRWLRLPPGAQIDKSDMDHWKFPVGTQLYKEFSSPDGVLLETRLIERTGEGSEDYWMGSFVWLADGSDAIYAPDGAEDIRGTDHDAPSSTRCWSCHGGEPGRILGWSAIQAETGAPGDPVTAAALGYLHANCGHCHSQTGAARPDTDQILRLSVSETTAESSELYRSTVGKPLSYFHDDAATLRIKPRDPAASGIMVRMLARGNKKQMPPIATEHVDGDGAELVRAWIMTLPE